MVNGRFRTKTLLLMLLGLVLILSACGGGEAEDSGLTVSSPDGKATLVIAEGSLPEGVSIDDIQVDWAEGLSNEPGAPFAAVRLGPSGLTLSESAVLHVSVPENAEEILVIHSSGDGFEFTSLDLTSTQDGLNGSVDVDDFSVLTMYRPDAFLVTASATPETIYVGDEQSLSLEAEVWDPTVPVWVPINLVTGEFQRMEFQIISIGLATLRGGGGPANAQWDDLAEDGGIEEFSDTWQPRSVIAEATVSGLSGAAFASSQCLAENDESTSVIWMKLTMSLRLVEKGTVVDRDALGLIAAFDRETNVAGVRADPDPPRTSNLESGDTIQAFTTVAKRFPATCSARPAGDTTSTSSPSSTSPAGQGTGSTSDSVEDPAGDLVRAFSEFPKIDGELTDGEFTGKQFTEAVDFVRLEVTSSKSTNPETRISLRFNGPAQLMPTEISGNLTSRSFGVDILIDLRTGRTLNVIYDSNGKIKISDIPSGMSITSEWLTPDELLIYIVGLTLDPNTQVEANLLLEAYGGIESDSVSLTTSGG